MAQANSKKMKVLIIVLICMLSLSVLALGGLKLYSLLVKPQDSVTVSHNQIGDSSNNSNNNNSISDVGGVDGPSGVVAQDRKSVV